FSLRRTVQVDMASDPGAAAGIPERLDLGNDHGFGPTLHRGRRGEIEARSNLSQIRRNVRSQIQFRWTGAGNIRKTQAEQIMPSIRAALHIAASDQRVNKIVGRTFGNTQLST